jgi:hypothetical protein
MIIAALIALASFGADDRHVTAGIDADYALVGCGTRTLLFNELYSLALFNGDADSELIVMRVLHDGALPKGLPRDWPPKLRPTVAERTIGEIDSAFGLIRPGSEVEIRYDDAADRSEMIVDDHRAVSVAGDRTYLAIRAMWFGRDPISHSLKSTILGGECKLASL